MRCRQRCFYGCTQSVDSAFKRRIKTPANDLARVYHFLMHEQERVKLLFGPYRTPRCKIGGTLRCTMRGQVIVAGLTDAPISWPYVPNRGGNGYPPLILCGDLVKAVRQESETAVAYWWGVTVQTVWKWRKALNVESQTEGTVDLQRRGIDDHFDAAAIRKRIEATKRPERNGKIAAAKRGKPRPVRVIEALGRANIGKKASQETRRRMSEAPRRRGARPPAAGVPWKSDEDALLGTMKDRARQKGLQRPPRPVKSPLSTRLVSAIAFDIRPLSRCVGAHEARWLLKGTRRRRHR